MFAIMFFAAGLVAAGLVGSRRSERVAERVGGGSASSGLADERGITLQTLIVTAVLVLMAVAAGVVIVAITNSSSDDLEESGTDVQARCNEVELYDPVVASRNELGMQFAKQGNLGSETLKEFTGPRIGCIPVCIWVNKPGSEGNRTLDAGEVFFYRDASEVVVNFGGANSQRDHSFLLYSGSPGNIQYYSNVSGTSLLKPTLGPKVDRVAVAPNQNECHTYDEGGNVLLAGA